MNLGQLDISRVFFTADQHFGHTNIIRFAERPFNDLLAMEEALVEAWNNTVPLDGLVFHLGDFTLTDNASPYMRRLNGKVKLLANWWHHDRRWMDIDPIGSPRFDSLPRPSYDTKTTFCLLLPPMLVLEVPHFAGPDGRPKIIHLSHYPIAEWDRKHYGAWHLHGHSHNKFVYPPGSLALDVGVDSAYALFGEYRPFSALEIRDIMESRLQEDA